MTFRQLVFLACFIGSFTGCAREGSNGATQPELKEHSTRLPDVSVSPLPDSAFLAEWRSAQVPSPVEANQTFEMIVRVRNVGTTAWPARGAQEQHGFIGAVRASHRWWAPGVTVPITRFDDTDRVALPNAVLPGEEVALSITARAPHVPGQFEIEFDLVQENVSWFQDKGAKTLKVPVEVR